MSLHDPAAPRRAAWPFVLAGVLAVLLVGGAATFFLVRRDTPTATVTQDSGQSLAEGVSVGGVMSGAAKTLADTLAGRGLECSVRFTTADGGHSGCFAEESGTSIAVVYQYQPDGTVGALTIDVKGKGETAPTLQATTAAVGQVAFPKDVPGLLSTLRNSWGGASEGSWGKYEMLARGKKTVLNAEKFGNKQLKVPSLSLGTTEPELAKALTADGYTCAADHETCQGRYADRPGLALKFSGPDDGGLTYLVGTAATGATTGKAFEQLRTTVFGHLRGDAVTPVQEWIGRHLDGRSHIAYVAGWRVSLEVTPSKQTRLTLFNDWFFLQMT
ncbi:hypothetical protein [Kribbella sp.]|uniref:hypothetical protein n=1 Tax=Kribbella sp. TaxID=1871183 RepID=UPI002D63678C|nr:hypothetical protein [Kribbella sp.]HZX07917.1 hypothetical protein [Kribbella sp.]